MLRCAGTRVIDSESVVGGGCYRCHQSLSTCHRWRDSHFITLSVRSAFANTFVDRSSLSWMFDSRDCTDSIEDMPDLSRLAATSSIRMCVLVAGEW